jgi:hypothetical protein
MPKISQPLVLDLSEVGPGDVELVGGKCASLGELFRSLAPRGVRAVDGFATTRRSESAAKRLQTILSLPSFWLKRESPRFR